MGQAPASDLHNHYTVNKFEDENIINQFVKIIKWFDQSGDRVSKNNKIYHICCMLSFNIVLLKVWQLWDSVYNTGGHTFYAAGIKVPP